MRAWPSSGTFRGRIRKRSASVRGSASCWTACWGPTWSGFHIQAHCNNFLETVDRVLESRIERERIAVNRNGHLTVVRRFPISVAMDQEASASAGSELRYEQRAELLARHGVRAPFMGVGVDRVDYTKGIPERFRGIERFFEKYPAYRGEFTFVQIGAPSRSEIRRYHDLMVEVEQEAERINRRFQTGEWRPIVLLDAASQPRRDPAVLPPRGCVHGHLAARRDEPGGQGIRRSAQRRPGRSDSEPLHRSLP